MHNPMSCHVFHNKYSIAVKFSSLVTLSVHSVAKLIFLQIRTEASVCQWIVSPQMMSNGMPSWMNTGIVLASANWVNNSYPQLKSHVEFTLSVGISRISCMYFLCKYNIKLKLIWIQQLTNRATCLFRWVQHLLLPSLFWSFLLLVDQLSFLCSAGIDLYQASKRNHIQVVKVSSIICIIDRALHGTLHKY